MKHLIIFSLALILLATTAAFTEAGDLAFDPAQAAISIEAGKAGKAPVTLYLIEPNRVTYGAAVSVAPMGTVPAGWVAAPAQFTVSTTAPRDTREVNITVPADAQPGQYALKLNITRIESPARFMKIGTMNITVNITKPSCAVKPAVMSTLTGMDRLRVPNNKPVVLTLSGKVDAGENCKLKGAWVVLEDEYAEMSARTQLDIAPDGSFKADLQVVASRKGDDKDGRTYRFGVFAENEVGVASGPIMDAVVQHDNRK